MEKKTKRPTAKQGGKKVPLKVVKEEDTKNDWGMIADTDEIDFDRVIEEEKQRKIEQARRDQELQRLQEEEEVARQEEILL